MVREIQDRVPPDRKAAGGNAPVSGAVDPDRLRRELGEIQRRIDAFVARAAELLEREHSLLQGGPLSPLRCADAATQALRQDLFGAAMSHGGAFKPLIDALDRLWFGLIRGNDIPEQGVDKPRTGRRLSHV
jgi:hypothetical protein